MDLKKISFLCYTRGRRSENKKFRFKEERKSYLEFFRYFSDKSKKLFKEFQWSLM